MAILLCCLLLMASVCDGKGSKQDDNWTILFREKLVSKNWVQINDFWAPGVQECKKECASYNFANFCQLNVSPLACICKYRFMLE